MAWDWSHTQTAYDNGRLNLDEQGGGWVATALAEIQLWRELGENGSVSWVTGEAILNGNTRKNLENDTFDEMTDKVWAFANKYRACDNGGHMLWVCPNGCHTVSADYPSV